MPVVFPSGHSHLKGFRRADDHAAAIVAGANFDVEFVSFGKHAPPSSPPPSAAAAAALAAPLLRGAAAGAAPAAAAAQTAQTAQTWFTYSYLEPSVAAFAAAVGKTAADFGTEKGAALTRRIAAVRETLGIDRVLGCALMEYSQSAPANQADSLWGVYLHRVLPYALFQPDASPNTPILVEATGTYRNSLRKGEVRVDDVFIMSPFQNFYKYFEGLTGEEVRKVMDFLGAEGPPPPDRRRRLQEETGARSRAGGAGANSTAPEQIPSWYSSADPVPAAKYDLLCTDFNEPQCAAAVLAVAGRAIEPAVYRSKRSNADIWFTFIQDQWPCDSSGSGSMAGAADAAAVA